MAVNTTNEDDRRIAELRQFLVTNPVEKHGSDQYEPDPIRNDEPAMWDVVIEDMRKRDNMGRKKHGGPLQPFNGRDALWDAYQEVLDTAVYLRQEIWQRDHQKTGYEYDAPILQKEEKEDHVNANNLVSTAE